VEPFAAGGQVASIAANERQPAHPNFHPVLAGEHAALCSRERAEPVTQQGDRSPPCLALSRHLAIQLTPKPLVALIISVPLQAFLSRASPLCVQLHHFIFNLHRSFNLPNDSGLLNAPRVE
jgi:hypothetical protein